MRALSAKLYAQVFWEPMDLNQVERAYGIFCQKYGLDANRSVRVRQFLAIGLQQLRCSAEQTKPPEPEEHDEKSEYSDEDIVGKLERLTLRAAEEYWRARRLTKMLNMRVSYLHQGEHCELKFRNGLRQEANDTTEALRPWHELGIDTFDRMSVLLSELNKYEHQIEWADQRR